MMKRLTTLVLALLICLSTALAWTCPGCGGQMDGKFCTECGTKKPANICPNCGTDFGDTAPKFCTECGTKMGEAVPTAAPAETPVASADHDLTLTKQADGRPLAVWTAEAGREYTFRFYPKFTNDAALDMEHTLSLNEKPALNGKAILSRLVPDQAYWIGVFDDLGQGEYIAYEPGATGVFNAFETELAVVPLTKAEEVLSHLTAEDLLSSGKDAYGLYMGLVYNNPGAALEDVVIQFVIENPAGLRYVATAARVTFQANMENAIGLSFYDFYPDVENMVAQLGELPLGGYKVHVYLNGLYASGAAFVVQDAAWSAPLSTAPATAPTEAPAAQDDRAVISDIVANGDGTITVSWTGGVAPYKVQYTIKRSDDFSADHTAAREAGAYWNGASDVQDTSATLNRLIPGETYWIAVLDANDKGQRWEYTCESGAFTDFPVTLEILPRQRVGEEATDLSCIPVDTAGAEDDVQHGFFLKLNHDNPGADQELFMQLALTFPDGFKYLYGTGNIGFASGEGRWRKWDFYSIDAIFTHLRGYQDVLPSGDLVVDIYLNGRLACSGTVPMGTAASAAAQADLTITAVTPQGDGAYLLTWEDNGHGPYNVYYHERFTDDPEADLKDSRGLNRWIDEMDIASTSYVMRYLMPGKSYWITLEDSTGATAIKAYNIGQAVSADLQVSIETNLQHEQDGTYEGLMFFSAGALNQDYTGSYGLYLDLGYGKLSADAARPAQWVLTMPNGAAFCEYAFDLNLFTGGGTYWEHYPLDWAFETIKGWYGEVPQGEYLFDLYLEGQHAGRTSFTVIE